MPIETECRRCRVRFVPEPRAIAAGPGWRFCPACRDAASEAGAASAPGPCPTCGRWLKGGRHRDGCPGRRRRRRGAR